MCISVHMVVSVDIISRSTWQPRINPGSTHMCPYLCIYGKYPLISVYIRPISVHIRLYLYISVHICSYPITCVNICTYVCICLYRQYLSIYVNICPYVCICSYVCICQYQPFYMIRYHEIWIFLPLISVHICAYKSISVHICAYLFISSMYPPISACIRAISVHIYIYLCIYVHICLYAQEPISRSNLQVQSHQNQSSV